MSNYYRFIPLDSARNALNSVSVDGVLTSSYGDIFTQNYPLTSSISTIFYPNASNPSSSIYTPIDPNRLYIKSLKTTFEKYKKYTYLYDYSSSYANYESGDITLINIPSIFYGESIQKGSVKLSIYKDGVLLCRAEDIAKNGDLRQTTGSANLGTDNNTVGLVFYDEGVILLHATASLDSYTEDFYSTNENLLVGWPDYPRWSTWGISQNALNGSIVRTSYDIEFNGVNKVPQLTLFAHADVASMNNSNNKTYIKKENNINAFTNTTSSVSEYPETIIKNIVKTPYVSPEPLFRKETYITKILIYDKEKNVIGIAKLATPIRKTEDRSYTFKLKLNL